MKKIIEKIKSLFKRKAEQKDFELVSGDIRMWFRQSGCKNFCENLETMINMEMINGYKGEGKSEDYWMTRGKISAYNTILFQIKLSLKPEAENGKRK